MTEVPPKRPSPDDYVLERTFDIESRRPYLKGGAAYIQRWIRPPGNLIAECKEIPLPSNDGVFFTEHDWGKMDNAVTKNYQSIQEITRMLANNQQSENMWGTDGTVRLKLSKDKTYTDGKDTYPLPIIYESCKETGIAQTVQAMSTRIERTVLGVDEPPVYEGLPLYGLCNHPKRITKAFNEADDPAYSLYHELDIAEATLLEEGLGDTFLVILSLDWVRHGVKPQNIESFGIHKAVLSLLLPKGTVIVCDRSAHTIRIGIGPGMTPGLTHQVSLVFFAYLRYPPLFTTPGRVHDTK